MKGRDLLCGNYPLKNADNKTSQLPTDPKILLAQAFPHVRRFETAPKAEI